jgi:opacity protein-like surface antigen
MKKLIFLLLLIPAIGMAQQTQTTTTTTTTTGDNPATQDQDSPKDQSDCLPGYIGFRFLPTFTDFNIKQQNNGNVKGTFVMGYGFGGVIGYHFTPYFGLQGEVLYSVLAQEFTSGEKKHRLDMSYINIPIMAALSTNSCKGVSLNIVAGPQFGINTGSKVKTEGGDGVDTVQAVVAVKPADFGFAYGAGLDFRLSQSIILGIGFRGVYGLVDISDNSKSTTTNQYYIVDRSHVNTYAGYAGLSFAF